LFQLLAKIQTILQTFSDSSNRKLRKTIYHSFFVSHKMINTTLPNLVNFLWCNNRGTKKKTKFSSS